MKSILTVCIGNICRSPMAEGLLAAALPGITVSSAGIGALVGHSADATAQLLMKQRGVDISAHRARQVTREMCQQADLVLVMDADQRRELQGKYPSVFGKIYRICEYTKQDVPDPYTQPEAAFREALALIDNGVQAWLQRIDKL